ncbi:hypothetical protein WMF18_29220 [Sorangium sp. So ce315]|uniref:hypothetical protein n=1 Tax=Sorangium sp. So ce315 TaxID=3133299 RepID=UPI003F6221B0
MSTSVAEKELAHSDGQPSPQTATENEPEGASDAPDAQSSELVIPRDEPVDEFEVSVAEAKKEAELLQTTIAHDDPKRTYAGYAAGLTGLATVIGVLLYSTWAIDSAIEKAIGDVGKAPKALPDHGILVLLVGIAVHGVISLAAVYFGYSLLKAAERLFVPERIMKDSKDVELVRALLGMNAPTDALAGRFRSISASTLPILRSMTELAKALRADDSSDADGKNK